MINIAKTIRELRLLNHYTQEQLANVCGVSRQAVVKWESGTNLPDLEKILELARLFHVSTDELLTGKTAMPESSAPARTDDCAANERIVNRALRKAMACEDPEEEITQFMALIGKQIACDRTYIFEQNADHSYKNTYEWCNRGVESQMEYLQHIPAEDMAAWLEAFANDGKIYIEDVDAIAESEPAVYRWLKPQGVRSAVILPLFGGTGFLGVDDPAPAFISQTSALIETMAHFIETMLQRRDLVRNLKWEEFQNDAYSRAGKGIRYQINVVTGEVRCDADKAAKSGYKFRAKSLGQVEQLAALHPELHDHLMLDGLQAVLETKENLSIEFLSYRQDREIRWNRLSISPFLDSRGEVLQLYGILQDISDRHQMVEQYNKYISHLSGGLHICYLSQPIHLDYASNDLCAFTGYTREEFDRVVGNLYIRLIVEEDRAVFGEYVQRLASKPSVETCEYRIRKKDGSIVWVIDTMESVADSNGIMYGYAYILEKSKLHAMLEMAEETEKRQLTVIDRQYEVLESLGKDYLNVFRVWLDEDKGQIVKLNGYVTKGMDKNSTEFIPYYRFCRQYIQDRVHPEDRPKMLAAMHPDSVRRAFEKDDEIIAVYRAVDNGETHFYQMKYVRLNHAKDDHKINFVAGFKNIDKVIAEEHAQKEQLQSRLSIISAILQAFTYGYYMDYQNGTYAELSNESPEMAKLIGKEGHFSDIFNKLKNVFPHGDSNNLVSEFLNGETLDRRLAGRKCISSRIAMENNRWLELFLFVVDYTDDGKVHHCIYTARDITEEKRREEEYLHTIGVIRSREQTAVRFAYLDTLTGVMNRNAFERDFAAVGGSGHIGFVFCDVNKLKETNDSQGHSEGDQLLKNFTAIIRRYFSADCIYRIGGDEFVCMISNIEQGRFEKRAEEFAAASSQFGNIAAVGYAYGDTAQKDELFHKAEASMYAMKRGGRDADR